MMTSNDPVNGAALGLAATHTLPPSGLDAEPLSWVAGEINKVLRASLDALQEAVAASDASDTAALDRARAHLHQVHGVLQMLELDGVTLITAAIENLLGRVGARAMPLDAALMGIIAQACEALQEYLDELLAGAPPQPARLFPYYRSLLEILGVERIDAVDLFFPDLSILPALGPGEHAGQTADYAALRQRFEKALLQFLKTSDGSDAVIMCKVIREVEALQQGRQWRAFWWVMHGFAHAVATRQIAHDRMTKKLFGRINQELRHLGEGGFKVNGGILKDALFCIARANPPAALQQKIRAAYQLDSKMPADFEIRHYGQTDVHAVRCAHEQMALAKACWSRIVQGDSRALSTFETHLALLAEACRKLHSPPLAHLIDALSHIARHALQGDRDESLSLEIATGLLVLESGLSDIRKLPEHFAERAAALIERLRSLDCGAPAIGSPLSGIEDSFSEEQGGAVAALVTEMQSGLCEVESCLESFFRKKSTPDALARLAPLLHQIEGALAILEQDAAVCMLQHTQSLLGDIASSGTAPDERAVQTLAQNVGALGLFMEALQRNPADARNHFAFDATSSRFHVLDLQRPRVDADEQCGPEDEVVTAREEAAQALPALDPSAAVSSAPAAEPALESAAEPEPEPEPALAEALAAPSDADEELRMIFLEEAHEVLGTISETLLSVQRAFGNADYLGVLRRCFHTLKGSARMIALSEFGEAAHRLERLLNLRLSSGAANDADLNLLLWRAHAELSAWIGELASSGISARTAEEFWRQVATGDQSAPELVNVPGATASNEVATMPADCSAELTDATDATSADDGIKQIGALEMSMPLYAIYRSESEGLLRTLSRDLLDWRRQPDRYVSIPAVHAVHSLAGSSATVGLPAVHQIAFAIEAIMQHQVRKPVKFSVDEFDALDAGIARIGTMLEGVAGGRMPACDPATADSLQRVLLDIGKRADAWLDQPGAAHSSAPEPELAVAGKPVTFTALKPEPMATQTAPALPPLSALPLHAEDDAALHDAPDADLLAIFIEEARDIMPLFGQTLRDWRHHPLDATLALGLLRMTHTLKGSARMAGAMRLGQHMHALETQIEESLNGQPLMSPNFDALLLQHDRALQLYEQLLTLSNGSEGSEAGEDAAEMALPASSALSNGAPPSAPLVRVRADILDRLVNQAGEVSISRSKLETEIASLHLLLADLNDNVARLRQQLRELEMQAESQIGSQINPPVSGAVEREFDALEFDRYTRLQELTRMMAESVDDVGTVQQGLSSSLASASMGLTAQGRLTRDLQQDLMRVRMVPFGSLSDRLYRVVRQTARDIGKRVTLDILGSSLEVDRGVLDRMAGPFEHLLRNAIVHGIEAAEVRRAAGKPDTGELQVGIRQEGNEVVLQFADDGAGLDMLAVRARAIAAGMLDAADEPTDAELIELIFNSGFSTAASLTQAAGRGVGMDAVRSEVARLGGTVAIASESGHGMRVTIRLPLTLAITQVVLVSAAGRTYALPSISVEQVLQLKPEPFASACEEGAVQWQSQRIGMLYLSHLLGDHLATPLSQQYASVVILKYGLQRIAVHVDELQGNREVVVKNVGAQLAGVAGISGATVLGSGEIVLILNPLQLMQRLQQRPSLGQTQAVASPAPVARPAIVMVVDDSMTVRRVTQRLLVREGYQVVLAKDGVDALERLQSVIPDVMLVDIEMPRMDGFDLTRNVRDDERTRGIPIFIITSRTAAKHRNVAMALGVDKYFGKPYQEADLLKAIERVVKSHAAGALH